MLLSQSNFLYFLNLCHVALYLLYLFFRWKRVFNLRVFSSIKPLWTTSFYAILVILIFLFAGNSIASLHLWYLFFYLDSIRQMRKYAKPDETTIASFDSKMDRLFKECRGQRNFYITGFALFLIM